MHASSIPNPETSPSVPEVGDFYDPEIDGHYTANGGGK